MMMPSMDFVDEEAADGFPAPMPTVTTLRQLRYWRRSTLRRWTACPVPPRRWLVPDWMPMASATSLYGAGGEGKTLLAQMLATACAIGAKWLGIPVRQCNSLLHFCEDDLDEMHRRQDDINRHYGCNFADLAAMRWLPRLGGRQSF